MQKSAGSPGQVPGGTRVTLGIDPGTAIVGYAVVEARGSALNMIACDVITTPAGMPLARANGGLTIAEYTPRQVKQAVTGYGNADKIQVGEMVRILLNLRAVPRPDDAADAAAVAICHLNTVPLLRERSANPWEGR